jgi:FtsH-binding integral membrane protein
MNGNLAFKVYNYLTAILILTIIVCYNIGLWPFEENLMNKSYIPSAKAPKYIVVSSLVLGQIMILMLILYILINQHRKISVLFTNV